VEYGWPHSVVIPRNLHGKFIVPKYEFKVFPNDVVQGMDEYTF